MKCEQFSFKDIIVSVSSSFVLIIWSSMRIKILGFYLTLCPYIVSIRCIYLKGGKNSEVIKIKASCLIHKSSTKIHMITNELTQKLFFSELMLYNNQPILSTLIFWNFKRALIFIWKLVWMHANNRVEFVGTFKTEILSDHTRHDNKFQFSITELYIYKIIL